MRSGLDLETVAAEFERWRATTNERRIPEDLWAAAVELRDRHAPSKICRRLRVSLARFRQECARGRRLQGRGTRTRDLTVRAVDPRPHAAAVLDGFVEMPPVNLLPPVSAAPGMTEGWRLTLESATSTVTVTMTTAPDPALLEAVWRLAASPAGRA